MPRNQIVYKDKPYLVYLNKSYDVWASDAIEWIDRNGYKREDFHVISEVLFWLYISKDQLSGIPCYFVKDILIPH